MSDNKGSCGSGDKNKAQAKPMGGSCSTTTQSTKPATPATPPKK